MPFNLCDKASSSTLSNGFTPRFRINVAANQGGRKYMEDRVQIELVRLPSGAIDFIYFGVYDGHGGAEASEFVRNNLLKKIQSQSGFNGSDAEMLEAIRNGFMDTHMAMRDVVDGWPLTASGYTSTSGTTASCVFIRRGKIFIGHVGDSAVILGEYEKDNEVKCECLTVDHKPDSVIEEQRINSAGGMIMKKSGVMRVVWTRPARGHVGPVRRSTPTESIAFLAVARALGDLWSYNRDTKQFIVSPEPDVTVLELDAKHKCIVLGSDGLTNVLRPQQIVEAVLNYERMPRDKHGRLPNHSRWLLSQALQSWGLLRADNISIITVIFDNSSNQSENFHDEVVIDMASEINLVQRFTIHPECSIIIGAEFFKQLRTMPVELVYNGTVDPNFSTDVDYEGPGFAKFTARTPTTSNIPMHGLALITMPEFGRLPSMQHLSSFFDSGSQANIFLANREKSHSNLPLNCDSFSRSVEVLDEEMRLRRDLDINEDISSAELPTKLSYDENFFQSGDRTSRKRPIRLKSTINEFSLQDSSGSYIRVTPLTSNLGSTSIASSKSPRKVLCAKRRMERTHFNRIMIGDDENNSADEALRSLDSGNNDDHDFESKKSRQEAKNCGIDKYSQNMIINRSFGSASALSPSLMLAALRTIDWPLRNGNTIRDPLTRDVTLAELRPRISLSSTSSSTNSSLLKRPRLSAGENVENILSNKNGQLNFEGAKSAASSKPFRFWEFLANFIGSRGKD